jgi:hypothetical protein
LSISGTLSGDIAPYQDVTFDHSSDVDINKVYLYCTGYHLEGSTSPKSTLIRARITSVVDNHINVRIEVGNLPSGEHVAYRLFAYLFDGDIIIEKHNVTLSSGSSSLNVSLTNPFDQEHSFVVGQVITTDDISLGDALVTFDLQSSSNVVVSRGATNGSLGVSLQVIYSCNFSVEKITQSFNSNQDYVSLSNTNIDIDNSFVVLSEKTGSSIDYSHIKCAEIVNDNGYKLSVWHEAGDNGNSVDVVAYVVRNLYGVPMTYIDQYMLTEDSYYILTEDSYKIRLEG